MKNLWNRWKALAQILGNFQARLLLSIFYLILVAPIALGVKLFSDPLRLKRGRRSNWVARPPEPENIERMRRQS